MTSSRIQVATHPSLSPLKGLNPCPTCGRTSRDKTLDEYILSSSECRPASPEPEQKRCEILIDQTIRPYTLRHASFRALTWAPTTSTALSYIAPFLGFSPWLVAIGPWGLVGIGMGVFLGVLGHGLIQHFSVVVPAATDHAKEIAQHKKRLEAIEDITTDLKKRLQDLNNIEKIRTHDWQYFFVELLLAGPLASLNDFYQILKLILNKLQQLFWQLINSALNLAVPAY